MLCTDLGMKRFLYIYLRTLSHPFSLVISRFQPHGLLPFLGVSKTPSCVLFFFGGVGAGILFLSASS